MTKSKITQMTDERNWGGKRDNQTGRPKLPGDQKRVKVGLRVKPETKAYLESASGSMGKEVDSLVVFAKAKKKKLT